MENNTSFIKIEGIKKYYPYKSGKLFGNIGGEKKHVKAVDGVDIEMKPGEILGVIGESGCGKSTLGRLLVRLEEPTDGDVFIDGVSTKEMLKHNPKEFRRNVQIVFQNPFDTFTPRDTIQKILLRPLKNHNIGSTVEERIAMCEKALEEGGLRPAKDIMARYPHELSGGQLQRISIIRSMFFNPKFIIADEPVSMLDVSVRAEIINMILELAQKRNSAVVFISHDIALTRYVSDYIAVMYLGRIVEYGTADDVVKNPKHPYTRALISNCASIDPFDDSENIDIDGEPPTPVNPGPGCYFRPRCYMARPECANKYPGRYDFENGHYAYCDRIGGEK